MRDPNRLYDFYKELQTIHIRYFSDQRFGQLISNFYNWVLNTKGIDPFFPEEDKTIGYLREYAESFGNEVI